MAYRLPDDAETLQDDEGCSYTSDAFRKAADGTPVWCVYGDRAEEDDDAVAVMISCERYDELLDYEFRYQSVSK